tara:strand:+ start:8217 stop:9116 length:900 start_codon:yes stop_codon:yes gene_type:complete
MALFSNKIESVKFVDRNEKTIEVLYKQKTDSKTLSHYIVELNYDNQDFLDLIEEYSIEDIQDNTQKYYKNLTQAKNDNILNHAKVMFDEWVINAQKDLDKQDEERYKIFEKYREQQLQEADAQVERRVQEGYKGIQAAIDKQYKEVEAYKEEQLKILQAEVDEQVERRIAEGFADVDTYREKQLSILQDELDEQVKQRYEEADAYKKSQINIIQQEVKTDLLSKFNKPSAPIRYTPEKVAEYIIDNFKNEDMVFKTKLAIFNLPEVKNNQDREIKMKVRKAKSIPELFAVYNDIQHNHS